jgi:hypothetical protein
MTMDLNLDFGRPWRCALRVGTAAVLLSLLSAFSVTANATGTWEQLGNPSAYLKFNAVSWGPNRVDVFMRLSSTNALSHRWFDGSIWQTENLGGAITSAPVAVSWGVGHLAVFARGQDNAVWTRSYNGSWSPWVSLGGKVKESIAVMSTGTNNIYLFAQGQFDELWTISYNGGWGAWTNLSGVISGGVAAAPLNSGYLAVLANGQYSGQIWYRTLGPSGWGPWQLLDGAYSSLVGIAPNGSGQIHLLAGSTSGALHRLWDGTSASSWQNLGSGPFSLERIVSRGSGLVDVYADGLGSSVNWGTWRISFNGASWGTWENLGGPAGVTPGGRIATASWGSGRVDVLVSSLGTSGLYHWYLN